MDNKAEWDRFLRGHWQKTMPQRKGQFPVATRDGDEAGRVVIYLSKDGKYKMAGDTQWAGFWWSEPIPDLPMPPRWEEV